MFAVIKTGGKQYRVAAEDLLTIERLPGEAGDFITFSEVLLLSREGGSVVGAPRVAGASVSAEIVEQARGPKVIAFKKRRRKNSRRKRGHRQDLTVVRIAEILADGAKPSATAKPKPASDPAPAPAATAPVSLAAASAPPASGNSGIAAASAAAVAAAKAAGLDTAVFRKLDKPVGIADDLKLISGVGPTIEKKLNGIGIWHFWQVRAMSDEDIAAVETEVGFKGRATRDEWKAQAVELMEGKGPRAKVDQQAAKTSKD